MRISIESWLPLVLLVPVAAVMGYSYYNYRPHTRRYGQMFVLRSLMLVLVVLGLCGLSLVKTAWEDATFFLVDVSDSMVHSRSDAETFVAEAIDQRKSNDLVGILAFGNDTAVQQNLSELSDFRQIQVAVDGTFTDIQQALAQTQVLFPADVRKRVVLLTDGRENTGEGIRQIRAMAGKDIDLDVYDLNTVQRGEVQVEAIDIPDYAEKNQVIEVAAKIRSNISTEATVYVYKDGQVVINESLKLDRGENTFVFTDGVTEGGIKGYTVEVVPAEDTYTENNRLSAFTTVNDMPHILVVQDGDRQGENFTEILEGSAVVDTVQVKAVPMALETLMAYEAFILADTSYDDLPEAFVENLQLLVQNQGKGLLVTGGDSSYGLGGYFDTTLEEMLPVTMEAKSKEEKPNLGIILVIDKSGSMASGQYGISKMSLAKEAAVRSTEILDEKDYLGVIGFDSEVKWVVPTTNVTNVEKLQKQIGTLVPGGGTTIRPSLETAVTELAGLDCGLKHIILLTDGQAENSGYESVIEELNQEKITLSTVAVGQESDRYLLFNLAQAGGGRYYETDVFTDIPSIFTKEAYMAGKKYMNDVTFYPEVQNYGVMLSGITDVASLDGYVAVSPKGNAQVILSGPDEDPIMAVWQYGLGRTMAWTSDMNGLWTADWLNWPGNRHLWVNSLSWLVQQQMNTDYTLSAVYEDGLGKITLENHGKLPGTGGLVSGLITSPGGEAEEVQLKASAPGIYEGSFKPSGEGVYLVSLGVASDGGIEQILSGVSVGYSPEFDFFGHDGIMPEEIAVLSGGRLLTDPGEVFDTTPPPAAGSRDLTGLLYLLALLVLLLELVIRKTSIRLPGLGQVVKGVRSAASLDSGKKERKLKKEDTADTSHIDELLKGRKM